MASKGVPRRPSEAGGSEIEKSLFIFHGEHVTIVEYTVKRQAKVSDIMRYSRSSRMDSRPMGLEPGTSPRR